jgi:protein O-mannosyl-transferase
MDPKKKAARAAQPFASPLAPAGKSLLSSTFAPLAILVLLTVLLYGNTLRNGYALDDSIVITDNQYTKQGFAGLGKIFTSDAFEGFFGKKKDLVEGGRYRPLSIATFAVEWSISPKNAALSHAGNIVLYALLAILLFAFLRMLFPERDGIPFWQGIPFIITLLFLAHPIHTEVVANIKGRDELMAMLFLVGAMIAAFKYVDTKQVFWLAVSFVAFFLGLLSKETPLPFVVVLPLSLWLFRRDARVGDAVIACLPVVVATVAYLALRFTIVGFGGGAETQQSTEILNNPFIGVSSSDRAATVMETWGMYLVKLFAPISLSHDYYFNQIPITTWQNPVVLLSLALNLGLIATGIWLYLKRNAIGFGILFYFITFSITSNLVISIGVTMGERFVFVPSLGFLIAVVLGMQMLFKRIGLDPHMPLLYIAIAVSCAFGLKTVTRNLVWKDNYTLFTTDADASPNSAKVQTAAGGVMIEKGDDPKTPASEKAKLYTDAIGHLNKAVKIYPEHGNAWLLMGNAKHKLEDYAGSMAAYENAMRFRPLLWDAYMNAAITSRKIKRFDLASGYYKLEIHNKQAQQPPVDVSANLWFDYGNNFEEWGGKADSAIWAYGMALQKDPKMAKALGQTGRVYGMQLNNLDQAIAFGERAVAIDPKMDWVYENIGIATAMKGDPLGAIAIFQRGLATNANNANLYRNMGVTYQTLGDMAKAQECFAKAQQLSGGK